MLGIWTHIRLRQLIIFVINHLLIKLLIKLNILDFDQSRFSAIMRKKSRQMAEKPFHTRSNSWCWFLIITEHLLTKLHSQLNYSIIQLFKYWHVIKLLMKDKKKCMYWLMKWESNQINEETGSLNIISKTHLTKKLRKNLICRSKQAASQRGRRKIRAKGQEVKSSPDSDRPTRFNNKS